MIINNPTSLTVLDILWIGFMILIWYLVVRRFRANRYWKRVSGKLNDIVVMGHFLQPYAMCFFTFIYEGKEIKGFDIVATTSVKRLRSADTIQIAINEKNFKKSIVCDTGWPLYGLPVLVFAVMTVASLLILIMQI